MPRPRRLPRLGVARAAFTPQDAFAIPGVSPGVSRAQRAIVLRDERGSAPGRA
jgi:hypothetical protein